VKDHAIDSIARQLLASTLNFQPASISHEQDGLHYVHGKDEISYRTIYQPERMNHRQIITMLTGSTIRQDHVQAPAAIAHHSQTRKALHNPGND
jgi:transcriptional regulator with AAA-type ATPase domain